MNSLVSFDFILKRVFEDSYAEIEYKKNGKAVILRIQRTYCYFLDRILFHKIHSYTLRLVSFQVNSEL